MLRARFNFEQGFLTKLRLAMDDSQSKLHGLKMRAITGCSMCPWLTMQLPLWSTFKPSAGCDGPHSHMGYDELSTSRSLSCPSIINMVFKAFVPMAFGSVNRQLQGTISTVAINRTWYLVFDLFRARTSGGLEVSP